MNYGATNWKAFLDIDIDEAKLDASGALPRVGRHSRRAFGGDRFLPPPALAPFSGRHFQVLSSVMARDAQPSP